MKGAESRLGKGARCILYTVYTSLCNLFMHRMFYVPIEAFMYRRSWRFRACSQIVSGLSTYV